MYEFGILERILEWFEFLNWDEIVNYPYLIKTFYKNDIDISSKFSGLTIKIRVNEILNKNDCCFYIDRWCQIFANLHQIRTHSCHWSTIYWLPKIISFADISIFIILKIRFGSYSYFSNWYELKIFLNFQTLFISHEIFRVKTYFFLFGKFSYYWAIKWPINTYMIK